MPGESILLPEPWSGGHRKRACVRPGARVHVATRGWQGQAGCRQARLSPPNPSQSFQ